MARVDGDVIKISIHALREEGDACPVCGGKLGLLFLSTPSARRATDFSLNGQNRYIQFLSTPSARRATIAFVVFGDSPCNFYPRPPRGGRPPTAI